MTAAEFLVKEVQDKGWFAIANIYADNGLVIFPFTARGRVCVSPSAEMIFSTSRVDSLNSYILGREYVVMNDRYNGLFQTIECIPFESIQHVDVHLFAFDRINEDGADTFKTPIYFKPSEIESLTPDENGLYSGKDVVEYNSGEKRSVINLYPELTAFPDYHGLRIDGYKNFMKNQKAFAAAVKKVFGLSDCI